MSAGQATVLRKAMPPHSALEILRERTRALHTQLEDAVPMDAALASLPRYIHLLGGYLNIYTAFESAPEQREDQPDGIVSDIYHSRIPLLERDLIALDADLKLYREPSSTIPLPSLTDLDSVLGALYVVEGSALGGQVIYRQIRERLSLDADSGAAFFFGYGERTGATWKAFTVFLNQRITQPERAADAAAAMFGAFEYGLQLFGNHGPPDESRTPGHSR